MGGSYRHIVPDTSVYAADVKTGKVKTLGGEKIFLIKAANEGVQIYHNGNLVNVVKVWNCCEICLN